MPPRKRKQAAREKTEQEPPASSSLQTAKMTVAVLREELDSRGLDTRGRKAELVARLEAALAAPPQAPSGGPSPTKKSRKQKPEPEPEEEEEAEPEVSGRRGWDGGLGTRVSPSLQPLPGVEEDTDFSKAKRALKGKEGIDKKKAVRVPKVDPNVPGSGGYQVCVAPGCEGE